MSQLFERRVTENQALRFQDFLIVEYNFVQVPDSALFGFTAAVCQEAKWQVVREDVMQGELSVGYLLFATY
jgi:hypothetical protein